MLQEKVYQLIEKSLADQGFVLVRALIEGDGDTLQIMAEHNDLSPMSVADCESISRHLSLLFTVKAPEMADYTLEISSPGIDRPLTREQDYVRFTGRDAKIQTNTLIGDRKRFKGTLRGFDEAEKVVLLDFEGALLRIPFSDIAKAKLLIPEDLLKKK